MGKTEDDEVYEKGVHDGQRAGWLDQIANDLSKVLPSTRRDEIYQKGFDFGKTHQNSVPLLSEEDEEDEEDDEGGVCFIATAAYGTPMAKEVKNLCKFRDEVLLKDPLGREFVKFYYAVSPPIAEFIRNRPGLKAMVREALKPLVWFSKTVLNEN